jgi:phosphoserine phosphatase
MLVRCTGRDRPGITTGLLGVLAQAGAELHDMEQVVIRQRLTLDLLVGLDEGDDVLKELLFHGWEQGLQVDFEVVEGTDEPTPTARFVVTVIGQHLSPAALQAVTGAIASGGGNIDRIDRLSRYPVVSYEFVVVGGTPTACARPCSPRRPSTGSTSPSSGRASSAGRSGSSSSTSTRRSSRTRSSSCWRRRPAARPRSPSSPPGRWRATSTSRTPCVRGWPASPARPWVLERVGREVRLTPGARTFVRTLHRLGYTVAIVSGGFTAITDRLADQLGLDHAVANELEIVDGG